MFSAIKSDLIVAIKYFFKDKPLRWKEFGNIQSKLNIPRNHFVKHISTRWLTIAPAAARLMEQWMAIEEYFLKYIPKNCPYIEKTATYKPIRDFIKKLTMKAQIRFVIYSAKLFSFFTEKFQSEKPLIHELLVDVKMLVQKFFLRTCKSEKVIPS